MSETPTHTPALSTGGHYVCGWLVKHQDEPVAYFTREGDAEAYVKLVTETAPDLYAALRELVDAVYLYERIGDAGVLNNALSRAGVVLSRAVCEAAILALFPAAPEEARRILHSE